MTMFIIGFLSCWTMLYLVSIIAYNFNLVKDIENFVDYLIIGPYIPLHLLISYICTKIYNKLLDK